MGLTAGVKLPLAILSLTLSTLYSIEVEVSCSPPVWIMSHSSTRLVRSADMVVFLQTNSGTVQSVCVCVCVCERERGREQREGIFVSLLETTVTPDVLVKKFRVSVGLVTARGSSCETAVSSTV